MQVRIRSFASRNQLAAYPTERAMGQELEWERRYVTVLGAANKRLYQFRLQTLDKTAEQSPVSLLLSAFPILSHTECRCSVPGRLSRHHSQRCKLLWASHLAKCCSECKRSEA